MSLPRKITFQGLILTAITVADKLTKQLRYMSKSLECEMYVKVAGSQYMLE